MNFDPTQATIPEMRAVVEGAVTHRKCPFCESEHWMPPANDRAFVVSEATIVDGKISDADRAEGGAISWVCGGCGFLRIHAPTIPTPTIGS